MIGRRMLFKMLGSAAAAPVASKLPALEPPGSPALSLPPLLDDTLRPLLGRVIGSAVDRYSISPKGLVEIVSGSKRMFTTLRNLDHDKYGTLDRDSRHLIDHLESEGVREYLRELLMQKACWCFDCSGYLSPLIGPVLGDDARRRYEIVCKLRQKRGAPLIDGERFEEMMREVGIEDRYSLERVDLEPFTNEWLREHVRRTRIFRRYAKFETLVDGGIPRSLTELWSEMLKQYKRRFRNRKWEEYRWHQHLGMLQCRYADYSARFRRQKWDRWSRELATISRIKEIVTNAAMEHWSEKPDRVDGPYSNWRHERCMRVLRRIDDIQRTMVERFGPTVPVASLFERFVAGEDVLETIATLMPDTMVENYYNPVERLQQHLMSYRQSLISKEVESAISNARKLIAKFI